MNNFRHISIYTIISLLLIAMSASVFHIHQYYQSDSDIVSFHGQSSDIELCNICDFTFKATDKLQDHQSILLTPEPDNFILIQEYFENYSLIVTDGRSPPYYS